jgi:hypothetical protein
MALLLMQALRTLLGIDPAPGQQVEEPSGSELSSSAAGLRAELAIAAVTAAEASLVSRAEVRLGEGMYETCTRV